MLLLQLLFSHRISQVQIIVSLLLTAIISHHAKFRTIVCFVGYNPMRQKNRNKIMLSAITRKQVITTKFILLTARLCPRPNSEIITSRIVAYRLNIVSDIMIKKQIFYAVCLGCQFQPRVFSLQQPQYFQSRISIVEMLAAQHYT